MQNTSWYSVPYIIREHTSSYGHLSDVTGHSGVTGRKLANVIIHINQSEARSASADPQRVPG